VTVKSKDYHDYFIKNGRFIGRFEEMYRNVDDPWHIDALGRRLDMDAALLLLRHMNQSPQKTLDVGCGKGQFTSMLREHVPGRIYACDVSPTAVENARRLYHDPNLDFFVFDLNEVEHLPYAHGFFDLIVMAQTIWCVLPNLKKILNHFRVLLSPGGGLLISQNFLPPGRQQYGRDVMRTPQDLMTILSVCGFETVSTLETDRFTNHHVALWARPRPEADQES
jgi:SAM-dependent methyltransferase